MTEETRLLRQLQRMGFNKSDFKTYEKDLEFCSRNNKNMLINQTALCDHNINIFIPSLNHKINKNKKYYIVKLSKKTPDIRIWSY